MTTDTLETLLGPSKRMATTVWYGNCKGKILNERGVTDEKTDVSKCDQRSQHYSLSCACATLRASPPGDLQPIGHFCLTLI